MSTVFYNYKEPRIHVFNGVTVAEEDDFNKPGKKNKVNKPLTLRLIPGLNYVNEDIANQVEKTSDSLKHYLEEGKIIRITSEKEVDKVTTSDFEKVHEAVSFIQGAMDLDFLKQILVGETRPFVMKEGQSQMTKVQEKVNQLKKAGEKVA